MKKLNCILAATFTLLLAGANAAFATPSGLHYMVHPASCQPKSAADANRLEMNNGVWLFRDGVEQQAAKLYCPVSFYGDSGAFAAIQLWYIDQFNEFGTPFSHSGYVQADLKSRERTTAGFTQLATIASNDGQLGHSYTYKYIGGGPDFGRNYYVEVTMWRENDNADVGFVGLAIIFQ